MLKRSRGYRGSVSDKNTVRESPLTEKVLNMRVNVLFPKDLTQRFNVCRQTILNWEHERRLPPRDVFNNERPIGWLPQTLKKAETKG